MKDQEKNVLRMPEELIIDMNEHLPGNLTMEDIQLLLKGKPFKAIFICNDTLMNTEVVDMLDLSVRSCNALRRAKFNTIGDILTQVGSLKELRNIRHCGAKSISEIMGKLFFYQYSLIPKERRTDYMKEILKLNGISST